ncbi:hypothetical protein [Chryseobacterium salviniae]|uniref:Uncharacterized protein n=1 Tax=Chryseobacterium salviniae TaxID=3101750 RepID=A0ABU6HXN6_9FLAO|nr:hypothetical protein [Chryseobacterium sp. T9W2-O]MEC3876742.1 hypothetical protein [Chryseobacterium sp. T9W2-O]
MKNTEEQIIELSKKILNNSGFGYDDENQIKCVELSEDSFFGYNKNKNQNIWQISFLWGEEDFGKSRGALLYIDDDKKLPLLLVHSLGQSKITYSLLNDGKTIVSSTNVKFTIEE